MECMVDRTNNFICSVGLGKVTISSKEAYGEVESVHIPLVSKKFLRKKVDGVVFIRMS